MSNFAQQLTALLPTLIRSGGAGGLTTAADLRQYEAHVIEAVAALELRAGQKLYQTTGQYTDGSMDQKSVTDLLGATARTDYVNSADTTLQNQININNARETEVYLSKTSNGATPIHDYATAFSSTPNGTVTYQQRDVVLGSSSDGVLGPIDGGIFNLNGGRFASGGNITLNLGSTLINGTLLSNGGKGAVSTQAQGNGTGGLYGEILLKNLRIGTDLYCGDSATTILDSCTFFAGLNGHTIQYSGTLIIQANCDLGGRIPVALAVAGKTAPELIDYRLKSDTFAVLPYAASIALNFSQATTYTVAVAGNLTFAASTNVTALRAQELLLTNTSGTAVTLAFPTGWTWFPAAPSSIPAGKKALLTLHSYGVDDSAVIAACVIQS